MVFVSEKFQAKKFDGPSRLYTKSGKLVCGYCNGLHRNKDCQAKQNYRPNHQVHQLSEEQTESDQNLAPLDCIDIISMTDLHVDTAFVLSKVALNKTNNLLTLVSKMLAGSVTLYALWDGGFSITAISLDAVKKLKWPIDENVKVQYQDCNKNTA
jgi:hypothetical protein